MNAKTSADSEGIVLLGYYRLNTFPLRKLQKSPQMNNDGKNNRNNVKTYLGKKEYRR